jgi:hypothetical protein
MAIENFGVNEAKAKMVPFWLLTNLLGQTKYNSVDNVVSARIKVTLIHSSRT